MDKPNKKLQIEKRMEHIHKLLNMGVEAPEIVEMLHQKYGITERQMYRDIAAAKEDRAKSLANMPFEELLAENYKRMMYQFRREAQNPESSPMTAVIILEKANNSLLLAHKYLKGNKHESRMDESVLESGLFKFFDSVKGINGKENTD